MNFELCTILSNVMTCHAIPLCLSWGPQPSAMSRLNDPGSHEADGSSGKISSSLMLPHNACIIHLTSSHHVFYQLTPSRVG